MGRHLHEKYTESELNQIIFTDYTKPTTKFLLVAVGCEDHLFTRVFKQKEIRIFKDGININTKFHSHIIPNENILLIEQLNLVSGNI